MSATNAMRLALTALLVLSPAAASIPAGAQEQKPTVKVPDPGVPEIATLEGTFIRAAYNNEGYAILGYKIANMSVGEEWMLLDFGTTVLDGVPDYSLTREALSLDTPDGTKLPLPSVEEYRKADLRSLEQRARIVRDSINYFPPMASRPCRIGFFAPLDSGALAWDKVEVSEERACVGRLYFKVPGGIQYGQHWLNVQFEKSLIRVPFRILTKDEEKLLSKNYKSIKKQVEEAFSPKKKKST